MKPKGKKQHFKRIVHFDEEKRKEYLTGFRKRKIERRQKAKEIAADEIKVERKRIKDQYRENMKEQLGLTDEVVKAAELLVQRSIKETKTHSVAVEEFDLASSKLFLGTNIQGAQKITVEDINFGDDDGANTTKSKPVKLNNMSSVKEMNKALRQRPTSRKSHFDRKYQAAKVRSKGGQRKSKKKDKKGTKKGKR